MTIKKDQILNQALELFSQQGFHAVSTNKIAKAAEVSEGLIFRHFKNKEGLLNAIISYGHEKAMQLFSQVNKLEPPEDQLKYLLSIPFQIPVSEYPFWRLLYSLKWQRETYDDKLSAPLKELLTTILTELNYQNPEAEAEIIMILVDGAASSILLKGQTNGDQILKSILEKYNLNK